MNLTIILSKGEEFFPGTIKKIPPVLTQGATIEETKLNVMDDLELYVEDMQSDENHSDKVLEEDLILS